VWIRVEIYLGVSVGFYDFFLAGEGDRIHMRKGTALVSTKDMGEIVKEVRQRIDFLLDYED